MRLRIALNELAGDKGKRYAPAEKHAVDRLFETLNTFPRKDPSSTKARTAQPNGLAFIDRLIVTHQDEDHIVGIDCLLVCVPLLGYWLCR
jgi:hypothetical protein